MRPFHPLAVLYFQGCRYYDPATRSFLIESSASEGVKDADFLLYVAANNTYRCQSSVAYATYCQLEVKIIIDVFHIQNKFASSSQAFC